MRLKWSLWLSLLASPAVGAPAYDALPRAHFNALSAEHALPLFWGDDANKNNTLDPDELVIVRGPALTARATWVTAQGFTPKFTSAYAAVVEASKAPATTDPRRLLVLKELRQARPTLVYTDLRALPAAEREMAQHVLDAAAKIDVLFAKQQGADALRHMLAKDPESRMLFHRNTSMGCKAPTTEEDSLCRASENPEVATLKRVVGLYPAPLQLANPKFCDALAAHKDHKALLSPFSAVVQRGQALAATPFEVFFAEDMAAIALELTAAADALGPKTEAALAKYLRAAAKAFGDGSWFAADEAWAAMDAHNSRWYLRVGPDETYSEPCNRKAAFHLTFALINPGSLKWQQKLDPLKAQMEAALAKLAGPPYLARKVTFKLPDFIDIVLNAGDDRSPFGATVGQSLPNWGPVANEGRGRTVAMTNLYTDADSKATGRRKAESVLCAGAMAEYTDDDVPALVSVVLHEAAHNLGPAHQYKVNGKTGEQAFGGPLASTLEELKAQTAAWYLTEWLRERGAIDEKLAAQAHTQDVVWAVSQMSRKMYTPEGHTRAYAQLAAIQIGWLVDAKVMRWAADKTAANGKDTGCFTLDLKAFPKAAEALMTEVAGIKARADKPKALALKAKYVDNAEQQTLRDIVAERWQREKKTTFRYSVRLD